MIYDEIIAYLSDEYRKGKTYQKIADEHSLSFGYIRDLIHGRNKAERMSLETFFKLFPSAQISLTGAAASAPACCSDDLERVRMESERDRLAHERRELELERRIFELEKQLAECPRVPRDEKPAPYHAEPFMSSPSTK